MASEAAKLDHFYDVQRQMMAAVQKRKNYQATTGGKLVHVKLKGHEDIANEFKRLVKIKSAGTYYAVKGAQVQSLISIDQIKPSKEVQRRIEGTEREIFSLLSAENAKSQISQDYKLIDININNCMAVLKQENSKLNGQLDLLATVEADFGKSNHYTNDGFLKRDVETRDKLKKDKSVLESKLSALEKVVQQSTATLDEGNMQLNEAEAKVTTFKGVVNNKREEIQKINKSLADARAITSEERNARNDNLCKVLLQRRALNLEINDDLKLKATQSLHARKSDIEKELKGKSEKLRSLKLKESDLGAEEKAVEAARRNKEAELEQVINYNPSLYIFVQLYFLFKG